MSQPSPNWGVRPISAKMRQPSCKPGEFPLVAAAILFAFCAEDLAEPRCCGRADGLLDMEIMPGHVQIRMADDALDRGQVNTHGLHLGHIGMAAAMGVSSRTPGMSSSAARNLSRKWLGLQGYPGFRGDSQM